MTNPLIKLSVLAKSFPTALGSTALFHEHNAFPTATKMVHTIKAESSMLSDGSLNDANIENYSVFLVKNFCTIKFNCVVYPIIDVTGISEPSPIKE